jgi:hypothetical protein
MIRFASTSARGATGWVLILGACLSTTTLSQVRASTLRVGNGSGKDQTYDVSGKSDDTSFAFTVTIKDGNFQDFGGPNGFDGTKGKEVKDTKVFRGGVQIASLIPILAEPGSTQLTALLAAADGTSNVYSFFDFAAPNYKELVANTDFFFAGFENGGVPILEQVGTDTRITDSSGNLFPQYQFNGATVSIATIANPTVPEPASLVLAHMGMLSMCCYCLYNGPHRMAKQCRPPQTRCSVEV